MSFEKMAAQMADGVGFIAALDQSGGSTPKALRLYGIEETAYASDAEMFDLMHEMRARIATAPSFTAESIIGAILFEMTMDREIAGKPSAQYLWEDRGVVPFLKIDKGLEDPQSGVQMMKPITGLDATLSRAKEAGIFGTKMRSVIGAADKAGVARNVRQQFEIGNEVLASGLVPILESEVTITIPDKAEAETLLRDAILAELDALPTGTQIMLKLTLPEVPNHFLPLVEHDKVMRLVALSGGYDRAEATQRLSQNTGIIASFSRALTQGLNAAQSDADFHAMIADSIATIAQASRAG